MQLFMLFLSAFSPFILSLPRQMKREGSKTGVFSCFLQKIRLIGSFLIRFVELTTKI